MDRAAAIDAIRKAGVVGAGGAGFPAHVKYQAPTDTLVCNLVESEPGFYGDKLLAMAAPEPVVDALAAMRESFGFDRVIIAFKIGHEPFVHQVAEQAEQADMEVTAVPAEYRMGEEKVLTKQVTGRTISSSGKPFDAGVTVQNLETVLNIGAALKRRRGVLDKVVQCIGELGRHKVLRAPLGTPLPALLESAEPGATAHMPEFRFIDGGPRLGDPVTHPAAAVVKKTTNGLLSMTPERVDDRAHHYPVAGCRVPDKIEHMEWPPFVRIPLGTRYAPPGTVEVSVASTVGRGQVVAKPGLHPWSVGCHSSIDGVVTQVTDQSITISYDR